MAVYFLIRSWWDGVGNRELIDLYGNWLLYLEINTYQLLVFWTNSMLLYKKNIISHAYMNHMRVKEYLKWGQGYIGLLLKIMGITYITQLSADICRDNGYQAVAGQIEIFSKLTIAVMSMPVVLSLFEMVTECIN